MKILVTGSRGYIGSVLMKTLTLQGYTVYGVDAVENKDDSAKYGTNYAYNINNPAVIDLVLKENIDTIFHLAASADVGMSVTHPWLFYLNNIGNTSVFVSGLIQSGWKGKIIFSSTAAVYEEDKHPVHENSTISPPNPYGRSKLACEYFLQDIQKANDIDVVVFRYFNVAGGWDDCGDHNNSTRIIARLCRAAYNNEPFTLNGTDKNTSDGTCVRDYLHVRDVCDAHLHAASFLDTHPGYHTFNLGISKGWSNKEIIDSFLLFTGYEPTVVTGPGRPGDPDHLVSNADKFINQTGFRYKHSSLENIICSAWSYYLNRME